MVDKEPPHRLRDNIRDPFYYEDSINQEPLRLQNGLDEESLLLPNESVDDSLHLQNVIEDRSLHFQNEIENKSLHMRNELVDSPQQGKELAPVEVWRTLNYETLGLILSYLDIVDLVSILRVCKTWRDVALDKLHSVTTLRCSEIKSKLSNRKVRLTQPGVERVLRLCGERLKVLDLRVFANNKMYLDLGGLLRVVGRCTSLQELFLNYPQGSKISHDEIFLPDSLKLLHIGGNMSEELLSAIIRNLPSLSVITLEMNQFVSGSSITGSVSAGGIRQLSLHHCSVFTPQNLHAILKSSSQTLEAVSVTGFPDAEVLDFDKTDIGSFDRMKDLVIGSWYAREGLKFSFLYPLLERMPNLTNLSLQHCFNLDEDPTMLMSLPQMCPSLETLDLTGCVLISATNLTPLAKLSNLSKLVLKGIKIVGEGEVVDFNPVVSDVVLKLRSLETLYLEDPSGYALQDDHVFKMISCDQPRLRKLSVSFASAIDGSFIDPCWNLKRGGDIDVNFTLRKGNQRGDLLSGKMSCTPSFLSVFVSWEE